MASLRACAEDPARGPRVAREVRARRRSPPLAGGSSGARLEPLGRHMPQGRRPPDAVVPRRGPVGPLGRAPQPPGAPVPPEPAPWLRVKYFPPYAPELNRVEQLWANLRYQGLADHAADDLDDIHRWVDNGKRRVRKRDLGLGFIKHAGLISRPLSAYSRTRPRGPTTRPTVPSKAMGRSSPSASVRYRGQVARSPVRPLGDVVRRPTGRGGGVTGGSASSMALRDTGEELRLSRDEAVPLSRICGSCATWSGTGGKVFPPAARGGQSRLPQGFRADRALSGESSWPARRDSNARPSA